MKKQQPGLPMIDAQQHFILEIKVEHRIGDKVTHKMSKKELTIIGYEYRESQGIQYIAIGDDQKPAYCIPFELEPGAQEMPIGFHY